MSRLAQFRLVARREVTESLRRRSVRIVLGVLLLASTAAVVLPEVISGDGDPSYDVLVTDARAAEIGAGIDELAEDSGIDVHLVDREELDLDGDARPARGLVADGDVDAAVVGDSPATVLVPAGVDQRLAVVLGQGLGPPALAARLRATGLSAAEAETIAAAPSVRFEPVDTDDRDQREGVASIAQLVLYIGLLSVSMQVANGTAIEKASRISEVLLAIVRPATLLFGKVVGVGIVSLTGVAALIAPVAVKVAVGGSVPASALPAIVASVTWFAVGAAFYATVAGTLGSLVERQEEVGTAMQPITVVLIATFLVSASTRESTTGLILALVPISSPIVEPARIALGASSPPEMAASLMLLAGAVAAAARVGGRMYRRAIVRTGSRLRFRDLTG